MTRTSAARGMAWFGAAGTVLVMVIGAGRAIAGSGPPPVGVLATGIVMTAWMLSPYWALLRLSGRTSAHPGDTGVLILGTILIVGFGAYAYLSEFVILPRFYGVQPRATGSGMLLLIVPLYQWAGIGMTSALGSLVRYVRSRRS